MYFYDCLNDIKHFLAFNFQGFREKMKYKKTIILLALVVFLLSIAGVSASEIGDTIASENANTIELSTDNDIEDNLQTSEENMVFTSTDYDEAIAQTDTEVLGEDSATYSNLAEEISHSGNITLTHKNYTYDKDATAITISEANKVIDGNGAVIDMNGSTIRAFSISGSGVTIKNLTIKNANYDGNGGAIYFDSTGTVTNCNFVDNKAAVDFNSCGGAVYFNSNGEVTNCNFTGNKATGYDGAGGAVYFVDSGTVTNCNFVDNKATGDGGGGGAVFFEKYGNVTKCNFTGNTADYGGAISIGSGTVSNCNFAGNNATYGGAIYFTNSGTVSNCNFTNNSATVNGGAVYFHSTGNVSNCNFAGNTAVYGGAILCVNYLGVTAETCIFKSDSDTTFNTHNLPPTLNVNNFTTVYGSGEKLTFDLKTNSSIPVPNGNILISVYFKGNGEWVRNYTCLSGEGWIPDLLVGSYIAVFDTEYAEFQKVNRTVTITMPSDKYYVNVTSLTTNNKTVNITAKTNVPKDIIWEGKLLFILPNSTQIEATYGANGIWWAEHTFDDYGEYNVNATYVGLDNVTVNNGTITINKVNSTITLDNIVLDYGETKNVTVTTTGATGITAKIDGNDVAVINNYTIPISGLGAGNYTLTVTTIADKNHNPVTKEVNITVNKLPTEIILANETLDLKVGDEVPVLANLTPAGAGNLTFTSSNEDLVFVEDNVTIVANSQGQAIITVSFAGNENYTAAENKTITVNVALNDASVSVENDTLNLKVDETCAINATINPDTIMLHIKYTSSNESVVTVDKNGIVTAVGEGRAIITLEVGDDEIYAKNSTTVTVTVNKINTTADVSIPENITVGDNSTVNVILPADATGNVTVKVDGEVVDTVPVKDGNADVTIPSMSAGNHTVEIAYSGDGKYNPVTETKDITVSKNDITPEITIPSDIEFGDNATVDIKLPGDATGNVTLTVGGEVVDTVPVANGTASVKLPALDAGNHTVEIDYSGDDKYKPASKTATIAVNKDSTNITASDVTATYKVDKYLVITLKDSDGNPLANATVTVDLNTIKNCTTDKNGQIKIKVSNLLPKTYSAKISYAGNDNYIGSNATAKVVVKKATPKITANAKTFKTATKTKKYTITLKDNTGKAIKNAKVILKVNGKTYKATTNSKGKATFKITKLTKKGTFKATITYTGNKYYNKVTKKANIKVISSWKTISKGSKDKSTVREIQQALKNHGYYLTAYGHYLMVDGVYADCTVRSVKEFQHDKGLKVTGKVDENTAKKLGLI